MGPKVAAELIEQFFGHCIGSLPNDSFSELASLNDSNALIVIQDGWSLDLGYLLARIHSDYQLVAQQASLSNCVVVPRVNQVKASVNVTAGGLLHNELIQGLRLLSEARDNIKEGVGLDLVLIQDMLTDRL